mmetsp:Transcript_32980/g.97320  ORF Transcript_32980/g.97320 Transcript_32980/m.97320 type:complete len:232 (-) Transcript_32980:101-796(-)
MHQSQRYLTALLFIVLDPLLNPLFHSGNIALHIFQRIGLDLVNNLLGITRFGLVQDDLHDFTFHVLVPLGLRISSFHQSVVQHIRLGPQDQDQIEPPLGEEVAPVIIDHRPSPLLGRIGQHLLHVIEEPILVEDHGIELLVLPLVELMLLDQITDAYVLKSQPFGNERRRRCLADARRAGDEDIGPRSFGLVSRGRVAHACFALLRLLDFTVLLCKMRATQTKQQRYYFVL